MVPKMGYVATRRVADDGSFVHYVNGAASERINGSTTARGCQSKPLYSAMVPLPRWLIAELPARVAPVDARACFPYTFP